MSGVAVRIGRPDGEYRRRIRLVAPARGIVEGGLEDDFHHFEVTVHHDGEHVISMEARSRRWPWSTCPDAGVRLRALEGMELSERCTAVAEVTDPHWQCTHQFDLAGLAVAHAARGLARRQYDVELPAPSGDTQTPRLWRDGHIVLEWHLRGQGLVAPALFTEAPWRGGFIKWADRNLEPEAAEAAIVLRRACDIGMGRGMDLEGVPRADRLAGLMTGVCYTMQPEVMSAGIRNRGSIRDFADDPDALLAEE